MAIEYVIAQSSDLDRVFSFAERSFKKLYPDEMDCMIQIWNSKFRTEALDHYLKLGWSFIAQEKATNNLTLGGDQNPQQAPYPVTEDIEHQPSESSAFQPQPLAPQIKGFLLAQPLLFMNGKTQTLWIEEVMAEEAIIRQELIDIAYKISRDKHLQGVLVSQQFEPDLVKKNIKFEFQNEEHLWLKTTK